VPTPQLALFGASETILADDANGRIVYTPAFVEEAVAAAWFASLRDGLDWRTERRWMYDREVDVPRLTAHFRLAPREVLPEAIRAAAARVFARTGVPFNSVGLNLYRDGRDSVAPHNDHLDELAKGSAIALLSLGSTRRMTIRSKRPPRRTLRVELEPGSLLLMSYATQLHYTHGIPKMPEPVGPRISVVFRVRPAAALANGEGGGYYR
jgi:alkylated DNA repair dioxygenase AlkB